MGGESVTTLPPWPLSVGLRSAVLELAGGLKILVPVGQTEAGWSTDDWYQRSQYHCTLEMTSVGWILAGWSTDALHQWSLFQCALKISQTDPSWLVD